MDNKDPTEESIKFKNIDIIAVFKQANELTKTSFGIFTIASAIIMAIVLFTVSQVLSWYGLDVNQYNELAPTQSVILDIILLVILAPLMTGLMMMGISKARGQSITIMDLFSWLSLTLFLALGLLITSILTQVGLIFLLLPGIYLLIVTSFTLPLIADKEMTAISAIVKSVKVSNQYLLPLTIFFFLSFILIILAAFTIVGLIWIIPLYFNAKGILYEQMFGELSTHSYETNERGTTFDA